MNHNRCRPSEHEIFETWTAFLRSLAPPSSCYDVKPFDRVAAKKRNDLLRDIYDVAEKEENFLDGNGKSHKLHEPKMTLLIISRSGFYNLLA